MHPGAEANMKGVVFTEFLEMVESRFSEAIADQLIEDTAPPSGGAYTAVGTYPHQELVAMVVRLAQVSGTPVPALLQAFGTYLLGSFVRLYPDSFKGFTSSLDMLENIEVTVHSQVLKLYPEAELPHFEVVRRSPRELQMIYRSVRHLGDLAVGLIEGCAAHFGETLEIRREDLGGPGQPICFHVSQRA